MVNFELTDRIRGALKKSTTKDVFLPHDTKERFERMTYRRNIRVISLEDLKELSDSLKRIKDEQEDEYTQCKWVHELVVGSRVVGGQKFSPTRGRPVRERDIAKIREGEAHNTMVGVEEELELSSADPALTEADMQLGSYVMVIMVVFYFAGFFILQAVIEEDEENRTLWAVFGGVVCAIVSLIVELWLWSVRWEVGLVKQQVVRSPRSARRSLSPSPERNVTPLTGVRSRTAVPRSQ